MAESVATGSTRDLWTDYKRTSSTGTSKATEVDGVTGDQNIADLFAAKYEVNYNSSSVCYREISEIHSVINSQIKNENSVDIVDDLAEVTNAIYARNANKLHACLDIVTILIISWRPLYLPFPRTIKSIYLTMKANVALLCLQLLAKC